MSTPEFHASSELQTSEYNRRRIDPRLEDPDYLHLSDIRLALDHVLRTRVFSAVLDYGCGGSPYRSLFPDARYERADIPSAGTLDYVFGEDSRIAAPGARYDCVLSTQVLEHVQQVPVYLAECQRVLRPGGHLILTTHGTFNDHGCPYDFHRWTADGLRADVAAAGFAVETVYKLTTAGRALLYLNEAFRHRLVAESDAATMPGILLRAGQLFYTRLSARRRHRYADRAYASQRMVLPGVPGHDLYIALLLVARRPAGIA